MTRTLIDEYGDTGIVQDRREEMGEIDTSTAAVAACPFCGCADDVALCKWWVSCGACGAEGPVQEDAKSALEAWAKPSAERDAERQRAEAAEAESARLRDALMVARNTVGDLRIGFARHVDPARWVDALQAHIDVLLARATEAQGGVK
jgi:hypothetical protein